MTSGGQRINYYRSLGGSQVKPYRERQVHIGWGTREADLVEQAKHFHPCDSYSRLV